MAALGDTMDIDTDHEEDASGELKNHFCSNE